MSDNREAVDLEPVSGPHSQDLLSMLCALSHYFISIETSPIFRGLEVGKEDHGRRREVIQRLASHLAPMAVTCNGPLLFCSLQRLELLTGQGCASPITLAPHYSDSSQMPFTVPRSTSTLRRSSVNAKEDKASGKEMPNTLIRASHFAPFCSRRP